MTSTKRQVVPVDWNEVRLLDHNSTTFRRYLRAQVGGNMAFIAALQCYDLGKVKLVPIKRVYPIENPREEWRIPCIARAITQKRIFRPIIITPKGSLKDGHHRLAACKSLGLTKIPAFVMVKKGSRHRLAI